MKREQREQQRAGEGINSQATEQNSGQNGSLIESRTKTQSMSLHLAPLPLPLLLLLASFPAAAAAPFGEGLSTLSKKLTRN